MLSRLPFPTLPLPIALTVGGGDQDLLDFGGYYRLLESMRFVNGSVQCPGEIDGSFLPNFKVQDR